MGTNERARVTTTDDEIAAFIAAGRTATLATVGNNGWPHLVGMWYAVLDGHIWFEAKVKSQKVRNLQRDSQLTFLIKDGGGYQTLRGVSIEGRGVIVDDPETALRVGIAIWERYQGGYREEMLPHVEAMMTKRVVVRVDATRTRSWDHSKLGTAEATPAI